MVHISRKARARVIERTSVVRLRKKNSVKELLRDGKMVLGTSAQISSPEVVEIIGAHDFDYVWIDMEHGHFGVEAMVDMVRAADACNISPIVRVLQNDPAQIMQVLDAGAMGVIVPDISTRSEAEQAVRAAKYYPLGHRGACPWTRAAGYCAADWPAQAAWSNQETLVWLLIEGKAGVENMDSILEVPGIDIILLGTFDLAEALGVPGQIDHPQVVAALEKLVARAQKAGVALAKVTVAEPGDSAAIASAASQWHALGGRVLCLGGDRPLFSAVLGQTLQAARSVLPH